MPSESGDEISVTREFVSRLLESLGAMGRLLMLCAVPRTVSYDLVAPINDTELSTTKFLSHIAKYSFVEREGDSLVFHDAVRSTLIQRLREESPIAYRERHQQLASHFEAVAA